MALLGDGLAQDRADGEIEPEETINRSDPKGDERGGAS